jgi:hypothetical protein
VYNLVGIYRYTFPDVNKALPPIEDFIIQDLLPLSTDYQEQITVHPEFRPPFIRAQILPFFSKASGPVRLANGKERPKTIRDLLRDLPTSGSSIKATTIYILLEYNNSETRDYTESDIEISPHTHRLPDHIQVKRERVSSSPETVGYGFFFFFDFLAHTCCSTSSGSQYRQSELKRVQ